MKTEYKYPSKFTTLGWKRFLKRVRKELMDKRLYCSIENHENERTEGFFRGPAHAVRFIDKNKNTEEYSIFVRFDNKGYFIYGFDCPDVKRAKELYSIIVGGENHDQ